MAGNGPAPQEQRRRSNAPARGDWVDLAPLATPVLPELPEAEDGWPPTTALAWESWRQDPVTSQYTIADVSYALDTIRLHAAMTPSTASEVRLRMDALGLTPKGKRDLRWRVGDDVTEQPQPKPRKRSSSRKKKLTSGAELTVVK